MQWCWPVEDATTRLPPPPPFKVFHTLNVSIGVLLSGKEEAIKKGAQQEIGVDGLVLLTEVMLKPALLLEQKKGVAGR